MKHEEFKNLVMELDSNSSEIFVSKNKRYSDPNDALHNFNSGSDISGLTPAQTCWGYMTKHLVALRDMVDRNDFSNRDDFLEKCQDTINYIRILWCIGNDANNIDESYLATNPVMICYKNVSEAQIVLDKMKEMIKKNKMVSVAQYYHLVDRFSYCIDDTKYGWCNLDKARVIELPYNSSLCTIEFPKMILLSRTGINHSIKICEK